MEYWLDHVARSLATEQSRRSFMWQAAVMVIGLVLGSAAPAQAQVTCRRGKTLCGEECVNLDKDPGNCGGCGAECGEGFRCRRSSCTCPRKKTVCGAACVGVKADPSNCGACGAACPPGNTCKRGACKPPKGNAVTCPGGGACPSQRPVCCESAGAGVDGCCPTSTSVCCPAGQRGGCCPSDEPICCPTSCCPAGGACAACPDGDNICCTEDAPVCSSCPDGVKGCCPKTAPVCCMVDMNPTCLPPGTVCGSGPAISAGAGSPLAEPMRKSPKLSARARRTE